MLRIAGAAPEHAARIEAGPHLPLRITWPQRGPAAPRLWWRFAGPRTFLETGWSAATGALEDVSLILPGAIARVAHGPPAASAASPGVPRADPAEWARRSASGAVVRSAEHYVDDEEPVRTELGPDHLLVRIGGGDEPAAREVACGRARFGLTAADLLLWVCVAGFSEDERTLLEEHAAWSAAPPTGPPVPPAPSGTRGWRSWLRALPFGRGG